MSLLTRAFQKIFGSIGGTGEFGQIGSKAAGAPATTKNLETMQALSEYDQGLNAIVSDQGTSVLPYLEDINSLFFLTTSQLAYLMQSGVAEWNDETEYYQDVSLVLHEGVLWKDIFGTGGTPNLNFNPTTNSDKWEPIAGNTGGDNLLINGSMMVPQRGSFFDSTTIIANNNDTYLLDRWCLLSDGNDIVDVSQQSGGSVDGNSNYMRLDVETISKKFGAFQPIENKNLFDVVGGKVSLSFEARVSDATKLSDIRAVVVSWDSTADSITSDIISAWNAEGVRPTLAANWTEENVDSNLAVTTSWQRFKIENIDIDAANAANVGVFFYQNDVATNDTLGVLLEITKFKFEKGKVATPFEHRLYGDELNLCQRYAVSFDADANDYLGVGFAISTTVARITMFTPSKLRGNSSGLDVTAANWYLNDGAATQTVTNISAATIVGSIIMLNVTVASGLTAFRPVHLQCKNTDKLVFHNEL